MSDSIRTISYLLNTSFKDNRGQFAILPHDARELILSLSSYTNTPAGVVNMQNTFDSSIANLTVYKDYVFGSSASVTGSQIAIRNSTDLNTYFNAYQDNTNLVQINSEFQRYQSFNSTNHAFATDRLNLCAVVDTSGGYSGAYACNVRATAGSCTLDGAASCLIANLGWANTTGVTVGTVVQFQFEGLYSVASVVVDTSAVFTPICGSPTTATVSGNLNIVTPFRYALTSGSTSDPSSTVTLASVPTGVTTGMSIGYVTSAGAYNRSFDHRITNIAGNVLTVSPSFSTYGTLATGTRIFMGPPITSGQIWTKDNFDLSLQGHVWGFDLSCTTPNNTGGYELRGVNTVAKYSAVDISAPWGAWPGYWLYGASTDGTWDPDDSEVDILELLYHSTIGPTCWTGANHCTAIPPVKVFGKSVGNWTDIGFGAFASATKIEGDARSSLLMTPTDTYKHFNNELVRRDRFTWCNQHKAQTGFVLAIGSANAGLNSPVFMPLDAANFPNLKFGIKRFTVYRSA